MGLLRWRSLPRILPIGIVNVLALYSFVFWRWRFSLMVMVGLLLLAGWCSPDGFWVTVVVMFEPAMFLRGYHGGPWDWLLLSVRYPLMIVYLVENMLPMVIVCFAFVALGRLARIKLVKQIAR